MYQRLAGKQIYLTITRPNNSYVVSLVSQFMHDSRTDHLAVVHRILRYLEGSAGHGILFRSHGHGKIVAYTDVDWAGSLMDRKSTTGYCTMVGGNLVSWNLKRQETGCYGQV